MQSGSDGVWAPGFQFSCIVRSLLHPVLLAIHTEEASRGGGFGFTPGGGRGEGFLWAPR